MTRQKGGFLASPDLYVILNETFKGADKAIKKVEKREKKLRKKKNQKGGFIKWSPHERKRLRNKRARERHEAKKHWEKYWGNRERKMANRYEQSIRGFRTTNDSLRRELAFYKKKYPTAKKDSLYSESVMVKGQKYSRPT